MSRAAQALACTVIAVLVGGHAVNDTPVSAAEPSARPPALADATAKASARPPPRVPGTWIVNASLTIPSIDVRSLRVVPYRGTTDDWPGTRIQDHSLAASPYGPHGGVGPGQVGNYLVTAHRITAGGPLRRLPALKDGDPVLVTAGGHTYEYRITETRRTSFRSAHSLAGQRAAVPGFPGKHPTRAMITLSACATPEDNAAGNFWRDDRHNPEHRVDKVGVLVATRKASTGSSAPGATP